MTQSWVLSHKVDVRGEDLGLSFTGLEVHKRDRRPVAPKRESSMGEPEVCFRRRLEKGLVKLRLQFRTFCVFNPMKDTYR